MPRVKTTQTDYACMGRLLRSYGANGVNLAAALKCDPATARRKLAEPQRLTLGDLSKISTHYAIPMNDIREAVKR